MNQRIVEYLSRLCLSMLFSLTIMFFPWEFIRVGGEFADVHNYTLRMYQIQNFGINYFSWENSIIGWMKFEFLWFQLLAIGAESNIDPLLFFKIITGLSAFLFYKYLSTYLNKWWSFIILINPITIDLLSSQIRSAFAFALFLTLINFKFRSSVNWIQIIALILLPFIHTSMVVVLAFYVLSKGLSRFPWPSARVKVLITIVFAISTAIFFVYFVPVLAEAFEDRRNFSEIVTKSFAYVSFWLLWGTVLALSVRKEVCRRWEYFFAMIICISAPLMDTMGSPGFRFVALSIPIIFVTLPMFRNLIRNQMIALTPFYGIMLFFYWMR